MKPSEKLINILEFDISDKGDRIQRTYKSIIIDCCQQLDKEFIDKEELKEKINMLLKGKFKFQFNYIEGLKEEILKLLEE